MKYLILKIVLLTHSAYGFADCMDPVLAAGLESFKERVSNSKYVVKGSFYEYQENRWLLVDSLERGSITFSHYEATKFRLSEGFCEEGQQCANRQWYTIENNCLKNSSGDHVEVKKASQNNLQLVDGNKVVEYRIKFKKISIKETGITDGIPYEYSLKGKRSF